MKPAKRFMPHEIMELPELDETDLFVRAKHFDALMAHAKAMREALGLCMCKECCNSEPIAAFDEFLRTLGE